MGPQLTKTNCKDLVNMGNEKFCLRWNDFEKNINNAFKELRDDKDFFDVTIACDDEQIQAHKVILAACSPFFRNVLRRNPHQHPLLYLKGVKFSDFQAVLNFMYHGEVNVAQDELNSFLAVAEDLRVKGLTQTQNGASHPNSSSKPASLPLSRVPKVSAPANSIASHHVESEPPPPSRCSQPVKRQYVPEDDIQEIVSVKAEPQTSIPGELEVYPRAGPAVAQHGVSSELAADQQIATYQETEAVYEDFADYQEEGYSQFDSSAEMLTSQAVKGSYAEFLEECVRTKLIKDDESKSYTCNLCEKVCGDLSIGRFHLESRHFPNYEGYNCPVCDKFCKTKNALACHKVKCRRSMQQIS